MKFISVYQGGGPRDYEKGGALCRTTWLADEENFRSQMV